MHNKTDANDAAMLAELARTDFYRTMEVKSRWVERLGKPLQPACRGVDMSLISFELEALLLISCRQARSMPSWRIVALNGLISPVRTIAHADFRVSADPKGVGNRPRGNYIDALPEPFAISRNFRK